MRPNLLGKNGVNMEPLRCDPVKLERLFDGFFQVPGFQRDYVWGKDEVSQLLEDIDDFRPESQDDRYFIGCIVVYEEDGKYKIIDGQQRLTTLYLILIAMQQFLDGSDSVPPEALIKINQQLLRVYSQRGNYVKVNTLTLQNNHNRQLVDSIKKGKSDDISIRSRDISKAQKNLLVAFRTIRQWLKEKGVESSAKFYTKLNENVNLVQIIATNYEHARTIFSTINVRGLALDALDIVKDTLYRNVDESESDSLFDSWEEMKSTIDDVDNDPMRFFRYFLMSQYSIEQPLKKAGTLKWFEDNDSLIQFKKHPLEFLESMKWSANTYRRMAIEHECHDGNKSIDLESIALLGGASMRQHLMVLLAAKSNEREEFERLVRNLESALFYSLLTEERSQTLEHNMLRWSKLVGKATGENDFKDIYDDMAAAYEVRMEQFEQLIKSGHDWPNTKPRLRYFLSKINVLVDYIFQNKVTYGTLKQYATGNSFHIEHILPQSPKRSLLEQLGVTSEEYTNNVNRIGNLTLLDGAPNLIASNKPYSEKKKIYQQSNLRMVRHMAGTFDGDPKKGKFKTIVDQLCTFDEFNIQSIHKRERMLLGLARQIWSLPRD